MILLRTLLLAAVAAPTLALPSETFQGRVLGTSGLPAEGVLVLSDHGGQALTGPLGRYQLEVDLPDGVESLRITALGEGDQHASLSIPTGRVPYPVPDLLLTSNGTCSPDWLPVFRSAPGFMSDQVHDMAVFDAGSGPELWVVGQGISFTGYEQSPMVRWDGVNWVDATEGLDAPYSRVHSLAVFDDGSGPALYAAGRFPYGGTNWPLVRWDGSQWNPVGNTPLISPNQLSAATLEVHDDGSGPALFVGDDFDALLPSGGVLRWDGSSWSQVGSGMNGETYALTSFQIGGRRLLVAGGRFQTASGGVSNLAVWTGQAWKDIHPSGSGNPYSWKVNALEVFDEGQGPAVFVGGSFEEIEQLARTEGIARWDGRHWSAVGNGIQGAVEDLEVFDDGAGSELYVAGPDTAAGVDVRRLASWDGTSWDEVPGITGQNSSLDVIHAGDLGQGPRLFAGGPDFGVGPFRTLSIADWDGESWSPLGYGLDHEVRDCTLFDDGSGSALYAVGRFRYGNGLPLGRIARWDGSRWLPVGDGLDGPASAIEVYDDGSGPALYVAGTFDTVGGEEGRRVARWDGSQWTAVGTFGPALGSRIEDLAVFDDGSGPQLYACGRVALPGQGVQGAVVWDGSGWQPVGVGLDQEILTMEVFAGGLFFGPEGPDNTVRLIRLQNGSLSAVSGFFRNHGDEVRIHDLEVFDDGTGPALFAGGEFRRVAGIDADAVVRFDGASYAFTGPGIPRGQGPDPIVHSMTVFDDGNGAALYAAGLEIDALLRYDGQTWTTAGEPVYGPPGQRRVLTMLAVDDVPGTGTGPGIVLGGQFWSTGDLATAHIGFFASCP